MLSPGGRHATSPHHRRRCAHRRHRRYRHAKAELGLFGPFAGQVGPAAYQVRSHNVEWAATLYLAQPVRHDNGVWVVTRVGDPVS